MGALSNLNTSPTYEMDLPSSGKKIKYRPFLVKEEKILQLAKEAADPRDYINATKQVIEACTFGKVEVDDLASFDIEMLFINLRKQSVGETIEVNFKCPNEIEGDICDTQIPYIIDLSKVRLNKEPTVDPLIELSETISITLKYPTFEILLDGMDIKNETQALSIATRMIDTVVTKDKVYISTDMSQEDMSEFVDNFTTKQLHKLLEFVDSIPAVHLKTNLKCPKCGHEFDYEFNGIADFFE